MKRRILLFAALTAFAGALAVPLGAQAITGIAPFQAYGAGSVDSVNLLDLDTHINIPIVSLKGQGMPFQLSLVYDNTIWQPEEVSGHEVWAAPGAGWGWQVASTGPNGTVTYDTYMDECWDDVNNQEDYYEQYYNFTYIDGEGVSHYIGGSTYDEPANCNNGYEYYEPSETVMAEDGSGLTLEVTNFTDSQIVTASGVVITPGSEEVDANGNEMTMDTTPGLTAWRDTLENLYTEDFNSHGPTSLTYYGPSGNQETVTVGYTEQEVSSSRLTCESGTAPEAWSEAEEYLPTSITFPDGSAYTMTYDSAGVMTSITLPTGGTIEYEYSDSLSEDDINCGNGTWYMMGRYLANGLSLSYSLVPQSTTGEWLTTAADPGTETTTEIYSMEDTDDTGSYATEQQVYNYYGDTPLTTTNICYNGVTSNCQTTSISLPITETAVTRSLATSGGGTITSGVTTHYNYWTGLWGLPYEELDYGFASGSSPGALMRQVLTTWDNDLDYVQNKPSEVQIEDGSGNVLSQTAYAYDQWAVVGSGGTPPGTSRGNLTTETEYTSSASSLSRTFTYFANGLVDAATDVNGQATTFTYGSAGCNTMPSQIAYPDGSSESATWNCTGIVPVTVTDANGQETSYSYGDVGPGGWEWRPTSVTGPAGTTNYTYADTYTDAAMTFNGGNSVSDSRTCYDGYGRPYLKQRQQGPGLGNFDTVETTFDAVGDVLSVTAPATSSACTAPTGALTAASYTYDSLGRPTQMTDADNGTVSYSYDGNDVLMALGPAPSGENVKQRQLEYDALGRLSSVCEVTSGTGYTTCGQTNSLNGFYTTYAYDAAGRLLEAEQQNSGASETRQFSYDWLGRMLSETVPESGTTSFAYDAATSACAAGSDGGLVQRADNAGNVTCYAYDTMHRVVEKSYPSGPNAAATPTAYYVYGTSAGVTVDGATMQNAIGRLAEAYTESGTTVETEEGFSYASTGQVATTYQESPNSGGWYESTESYYGNGEPAALSVPGAPEITYGVDGEGRPTTVSAGSGQNPVTAATYTALGLTSLTLGSGDSDSYTYDSGTGRMTGYQFSVDGNTDEGELSWNENGTLSQLEVADTIPDTNDTQTCAYTHDDLARLASANCGSGWSQTYSYDPYGNLSTSASAGTSFSASFNAANEIAEVGGYTPHYDSDGNLLDDPVTGSAYVNTFDSEGRPVTLEQAGVTYDALGRVVEAAPGGSAEEAVYAPDGGKIGVMAGQSLLVVYVPLPGGGEAVYNSSGLAFYQHADWQGSARLESTPSQGFQSAAAYAAYGELYADDGIINMSYTGAHQEIEWATSGGQYDFPAREYNPIQSRWWTPDPAGPAAMDLSNPQSFNRYAYADGEPLEMVDPSGEFPEGLLLGITNPWVDAAFGAADVLDLLFGGSSPPVNNAVHDVVQNYNGVDWNGALQGEVDGIPAGVTMPQALPFLPNVGNTNCDIGVCGNGGGGGGSGLGCDFGGCGLGGNGFVYQGAWGGPGPIDSQELSELIEGLHGLTMAAELLQVKVDVTVAAAAIVGAHVVGGVLLFTGGCLIPPVDATTCVPTVLAETAVAAGTAASAWAAWHAVKDVWSMGW